MRPSQNFFSLLLRTQITTATWPEFISLNLLGFYPRAAVTAAGCCLSLELHASMCSHATCAFFIAPMVMLIRGGPFAAVSRELAPVFLRSHGPSVRHLPGTKNTATSRGHRLAQTSSCVNRLNKVEVTQNQWMQFFFSFSIYVKPCAGSGMVL
jgi:hypothetical protein